MAHRLVYHSILGWRVIKKKKEDLQRARQLEQTPLCLRLFAVKDLRFRVEGLELRVWGLGFRV